MLNYEYPPLGGGAGNANRYLLDRMKDMDVEVDLVTSSAAKYSEEQLGDNISIYRVDVKKKRIHHWTQTEILRYMFHGYLKARKLQKEKDYDVIHAWFGFPCGLMARMLREPYLVALRGSDVPGYNERFSRQYVFLEPLIKHVWKNASAVVPNSKGLEELAKETLDIEMQVIPNGVDTSEFYPGERDSGKLELLCVSRLTSRKRIGDIIDAVSEIEGVNLTVIGDGPKEKELREKIGELGLENRVELKGYVPHDELPGYYRDSDVFVMPSLNEGMSNTILEAISSGLPVITTQTGGTDELVDGNGEIVPKKNPGALKEKIIEYRDSAGKIEVEGKLSREIAEQMSWERVADQYLNLYREIT